MRAFITHTTENYEKITINLIKSIHKYSNYPIIVYTIDYDGSPELNNLVTCRRLDLLLPILNSEGFVLGGNGNSYVNRQQLRTYLTLGSKVDVMLDASEFHKEWVYIDSDSIVNKNVDELFNYCQNIIDFPLASLGPQEYVLLVNPDGSYIGNPFWKEDGSVDNENTLEWDLMKFMGLSPNQRCHYRTTNLIIGNDKVKNFLALWKNIKDLLPQITSLEKIVPYHEETIYNVLCWKINHNYIGVPMLYINVDGSQTLSHFFNTSVTKRTILKTFYTLPENKNDIKVFHGEKRESEINKMFEIIENPQNKKINILFLAPHLSTGGMPSFLLKRIESLIEFYSNKIELFVVEYNNHSDEYVVQKNKIKQLIPSSNFWTLGENKNILKNIINDNFIDIIHLDEMIESFDPHVPMSNDLMNFIYKNDRTWRVVETCHNIVFQPHKEKRFNPDAYSFCTPWHKENTFKDMDSYGEVIEYPIEYRLPSISEKIEKQQLLGLDPSKTHVLNVGLWTMGKNQGEGLEIAREINKISSNCIFHFVGNQAPNFQNYWEPLMKDIPSNVVVWGERDDTENFYKACDIFMFNSTWECNPLVLRESLSYGLKTMSRNLPQYMNMFTDSIFIMSDDLKTNVDLLLSLNQLPPKCPSSTPQVGLFGKKHLDLYKKIMELPITKQELLNNDVQITQHYVNNPFLEIKGNTDKNYKVQFLNESGICLYEHTVKSNSWIKLNREYFTKWRTIVSDGELVIYDNTLNFEGKRVYISLESKSLGDSVAWIPYVLEFKKLHKCTVIVSTFWNELFKDVYPEIEFITPGTTVNNLIAMYSVGWFYDANKEPMLPNTIPLQQTITNIIGLPYHEITPKISHKPGPRPYKDKYITIATNSTSGCKFWTKEGWQKLINYLHDKGYKIINVSKEDNPFTHVNKIKNTSISHTMDVIHYSEFFIGLSSGLSWLAWALGKHVVMISNFTEPNHEFVSNCTRIVKKDVCNGCWNSDKFKFDKGDWNWCPLHKGTDRQFECHKTITSKMVIDQIQHLLE